MIKLNSDIRLTDELERQLMQQAIEEQARFKPGKALRNLFVKLQKTPQGVQGKPSIVSNQLADA